MDQHEAGPQGPKKLNENLLDEVSEEGTLCHGLDYRVARVADCADPACPCHTSPDTFLVAVKGSDDSCWGIAVITPDPDPVVNKMAADPEVMRLVTSVILYGASWEQIATRPYFVYRAQCQAVAKTPGRYWELEIDVLKRFRQMINTSVPEEVATLLAMTEHWAFDPGGTYGVTAS